MGKIVNADTFRAIKEAAARAERRQNRQKGSKPGRRARRHSTWNPSGVTILNLTMVTFLAIWFVPDYGGTSGIFPAISMESTVTDTERARFSFCHSGGGTNCVVDGDTIWYHGNNIRIADIDTPETHSPRCDEEAELGEEATERLHALLNEGDFSISSIERDTDLYGRQLRILSRDGESIGAVLVDEGLARYYEGGRRSWC
jgi:micrococcal nuclease